MQRYISVRMMREALEKCDDEDILIIQQEDGDTDDVTYVPVADVIASRYIPIDRRRGELLDYNSELIVETDLEVHSAIVLVPNR